MATTSGKRVPSSEVAPALPAADAASGAEAAPRAAAEDRAVEDLAAIGSPEALVAEMLTIAGPSGREAAIMEFIASRLREAGLGAGQLVFDQPPAPERARGEARGEVGNLILKLPGSARLPRRLLMAHVDTVPLCVGARPVRRGKFLVPADRQTALGADNRAGAAVVLATALAVLRGRESYPPLTFLWTVQEEIGLFGARYGRMRLLGRPRLAFNFDGGLADRVIIGATGGYRMELRVQGKASHAGAHPEQGISAVAIAGLAIAQLQREGWLGAIEKHGRRGTSNIGVIRGGEATNVVTPLVELRAEARSHDAAFRERIVRRMEKAFVRAAEQVRDVAGACGRVEINGRLDYEAFCLPSDDSSVHAAENAIRAAGGQPLRAISNGGLDANWMTARGIPTVTLGAGQENPHTTAERLDLTEFRKACRIAWNLATASG